MSSLQPLLKALHSKCGFESKDASAPSAGQVRLLGRIPQTRIGDVLLLIFTMETRVEDGPGWTVDFSKKYFKRGGQVLYGWRIILQAPDGLGKHLEDILRTINASQQSSRREVMEGPLVGASESRNVQTATGKGAGTPGQMMLGPDLRRSM